MTDGYGSGLGEEAAESVRCWIDCVSGGFGGCLTCWWAVDRDVVKDRGSRALIESALGALSVRRSVDYDTDGNLVPVSNGLTKPDCMAVWVALGCPDVGDVLSRRWQRPDHQWINSKRRMAQARVRRIERERLAAAGGAVRREVYAA